RFQRLAARRQCGLGTHTYLPGPFSRKRETGRALDRRAAVPAPHLPAHGRRGQRPPVVRIFNGIKDLQQGGDRSHELCSLDEKVIYATDASVIKTVLASRKGSIHFAPVQESGASRVGKSSTKKL